MARNWPSDASTSAQTLLSSGHKKPLFLPHSLRCDSLRCQGEGTPAASIKKMKKRSSGISSIRHWKREMVVGKIGRHGVTTTFRKRRLCKTAKLSAVYAFSAVSQPSVVDTLCPSFLLSQPWSPQEESTESVGSVEDRISGSDQGMMEEEYFAVEERARGLLQSDVDEEEEEEEENSELEMRAMLEEMRRLAAAVEGAPRMEEEEEAEMAAIREASICMMKDFGFATCTMDAIPFWARDHL